MHVDNDGNLAALGEWRFGAGRGARNMWMVTLGTGIGGGHVLDGRVQRGVNGFAGEIGHMVVNPDGPRCTCGRKGCWEVYASGRGLGMLASGEPGESVIQRARNGDADAVTVLEAWARWVAVGLSNLTNVSDPDVIVIGGGVSEAADAVMPIIKRWFVELLYSPEQRTHPDLRVAQLGEHAGAIGAACCRDSRTEPLRLGSWNFVASATCAVRLHDHQQSEDHRASRRRRRNRPRFR